MTTNDFKPKAQKRKDGYTIKCMEYEHIKALDFGLSKVLDDTRKALSDKSLHRDVRKMYETQQSAAHQLLGAMLTIRRGDLEQDAVWDE